MLDGLPENDTLVRPLAHTTDTHGFTEQLFVLCHLLGIAFMPRLKDLPDQHLYRLDKATYHGPIEPLFRGIVDVALIAEQWDQLVRIAASLKDRTAPAHVVLQRLINASPADRVSKALTALGRACKTLFILRYLHRERMRTVTDCITGPTEPRSRRAPEHSPPVRPAERETLGRFRHQVVSQEIGEHAALR